MFCSEPHPPSFSSPFPTGSFFFLLPSFAPDKIIPFRTSFCAFPRTRAGLWYLSPSADYRARRVDICGMLGMDGGPTRQAYPPETFGESRSGIIIGIVVVCWILSTIVVTLRVYTRKVLLKQIGADDYFAAASLVSFFISTFFLSGAVKSGTLLTSRSFRRWYIYWESEIFSVGHLCFHHSAKHRHRG